MEKNKIIIYRVEFGEIKIYVKFRAESLLFTYLDV